MLPVVVEPPVLADHPDAVLADVRWYLDGRDGRAAYEAGHLPGAIWVDLDTALAAHPDDPREGRHPLPTPEAFAAGMTALGIGPGTTVIAYDDSGGVTAGRMVMMLRMLGHDAALLDGGLTAWDGPLDSGWVTPTPAPTPFPVAPWPAHRLASADDALAAGATPGQVSIDARAAERFRGEVTMIDPRPGHIPGAKNAPWAALLDAAGRFRPAAELRAHFADLGIDDTTEVIASCGSGVSACMNLVALERAGLPPGRLYVASWSGWSADPDRPAALGG